MVGRSIPEAVELERGNSLRVLELPCGGTMPEDEPRRGHREGGRRGSGRALAVQLDLGDGHRDSSMPAVAERCEGLAISTFRILSLMNVARGRPSRRIKFRGWRTSRDDGHRVVTLSMTIDGLKLDGRRELSNREFDEPRETMAIELRGFR